MSYQVLARKWRPRTFEEVTGQEHITQTLQNAVKTGRIGHAYLFTGPRGVGKTTTARILAKALNCEHGPTPHPCNRCSNCIEIMENRFPDVIEIDGASNNSVDDVRDLIEKVNYRPVKGRYRVYIIDEVHMLSISAFNALLKTLEEPPSHVIFIFATTEPHKVPATIISRCQRFDFRKIPEDLILQRLKHILTEEGVTYRDEESLRIIAKAADGSLRDALSLLDQVLVLDPELDPENIEKILGIAGRRVTRNLVKALIKRDFREMDRILSEDVLGRSDIKNFLKEILLYLDELIKIKLGLTQGSREDAEIIEGVDKEELFHLFNSINLLSIDVLSSPFPEVKLEVALLSLATRPKLIAIEKLISSLSENSPSPSTHQRIESELKKNERVSHTSLPGEPRNSRKEPSSFDTFKRKLMQQRKESIALLGLMKYDPGNNTLTIPIMSRRQEEVLKTHPDLKETIRELAKKYLGDPEIIYENKLPQKELEEREKPVPTLKDIENSELLKKIVEEFEGRIVKIIPRRR